MQFVLKAPGTTRLKLNYDSLPSNFAFKFKLRRYNVGADGDFAGKVGLCRLTR
jgi:hypothetical protein